MSFWGPRRVSHESLKNPLRHLFACDLWPVEIQPWNAKAISLDFVHLSSLLLFSFFFLIFHIFLFIEQYMYNSSYLGTFCLQLSFKTIVYSCISEFILSFLLFCPVLVHHRYSYANINPWWQGTQLNIGCINIHETHVTGLLFLLTKYMYIYRLSQYTWDPCDY